MSRDDPQLNLRLPSELKSKLELSAKNNNRSLNAETVIRLARSFENGITISQSDIDRIAEAVILKLQAPT